MVFKNSRLERERIYSIPKKPHITFLMRYFYHAGTQATPQFAYELRG